MKKQFLAILIACPFFLMAQTDQEKTDATVSKSTIEGHINFLASDELRGRDTGSPELNIAARYLASTFKRFGVKPVPGATGDGYFQQVPMKKTTPATTASIQIGDKSFKLLDNLLVIDGQEGNWDKDIVFLGYGLKNDYNGKDVKDKIVFVRGGTAEDSNPRSMFVNSKEKKDLAKQNGAVALVEFYNSKQMNWQMLVNYLHKPQLIVDDSKEDNFNYLWLKDIENLEVEFISKAKKAKAKLSIEGISSLSVDTKNVVGMVEGTDPKLKDEFVIYSAHYDHVGIGKPNAEGDSIFNGTRDNAIGSITVLSAAENLAKYPTKRSALFILFTGEEKGLLGSKWYANHPLLPLNKMVYCFNSDNGGYNDTKVATIIGLKRTTVDHHIKKACTTYGLEAIDDPAPEQGLFDRSDNVSFAAKGVPAPTFSLGFRSFDAEIMKYYHQVTDNPNTVDYDYLFKFFSSYVLACRLIGNDPTTPFWVEGDKYYEAGKNLYK